MECPLGGFDLKPLFFQDRGGFPQGYVSKVGNLDPYRFDSDPAVIRRGVDCRGRRQERRNCRP